MNNSKDEITKDKVIIYEIIFSMIVKFILVIAGLIAFFIILAQIIYVQDNWTKVIYGVFDTMLGGTIYVVYRHYFPEKKEGNKK